MTAAQTGTPRSLCRQLFPSPRSFVCTFSGQSATTGLLGGQNAGGKVTALRLRVQAELQAPGDRPLGGRGPADSHSLLRLSVYVRPLGTVLATVLGNRVCRLGREASGVSMVGGESVGDPPDPS